MKTALLLPLLTALLPACGAGTIDPSTTAATDEPLTVTEVRLKPSGPAEINVIAETAAERALRTSPAAGSTAAAHPDTIGVWGGGTGGRGTTPCSTYAQSLMLELCDNSSPGCSTGNLACIYGSPQDAMIPLSSIPRGYVVFCRLGQCPPPGNFYQHVVQYRPNQVGPVFENRRATWPYFVYCSETAIDDPWWISAGTCASSQANYLGVNCLGAGSQFACTYDSDCCGVGAYCDAGTCRGGTI